MAPRLVAIATPAVSVQLDYSDGRIRWWAFRETSGAAAAVLRFWDGSAAGSQLIMPIALSQGQSTSAFAGHHLIPYRTGLFMEVVSGTVEGAMQVDDLPEWESDAMPVVIIGSVDISGAG